MKIAISNIAWETAQDEAALDLLAEMEIEGLEIAPTRWWPDLHRVSPQERTAYRERVERRGLSIVAAQALLFGRADLKLFDTPAIRAEMLDYLAQVSGLCAELGARVLVFGSPKNRWVPEGFPPTAVQEIAADFFARAGEQAQAAGACLGIEPNPAEYGCNFIQTTLQALALVQQVNHPGFRLHLDRSTCILNGENPAQIIPVCQGSFESFHISEPGLAPVGMGAGDHAGYAAALRQVNYHGWVSIEMRAAPGEGLETVRRAVEFAKGMYG